MRPGKSYLVKTEVQEKSGRVKVKVSHDDDGPKWMGRGRYNYMKHYKVDLTEQHRVFHIDGDIANDDPRNLTAIKFSGVRYDLKTSKVVFSPDRPVAKLKPYRFKDHNVTVMKRVKVG